jgi:hypothetical protein
MAVTQPASKQKPSSKASAADQGKDQSWGRASSGWSKQVADPASAMLSSEQAAEQAAKSATGRGAKLQQNKQQMALFINYISTANAVILGRWSSDVFLACICPQVLEWTNRNATTANLHTSQPTQQSFQWPLSHQAVRTWVKGCSCPGLWCSGKSPDTLITISPSHVKFLR